MGMMVIDDGKRKGGDMFGRRDLFTEVAFYTLVRAASFTHFLRLRASRFP